MPHYNIMIIRTLLNKDAWQRKYKNKALRRIGLFGMASIRQLILIGWLIRWALAFTLLLLIIR